MTHAQQRLANAFSETAGSAHAMCEVMRERVAGVSLGEVNRLVEDRITQAERVLDGLLGQGVRVYENVVTLRKKIGAERWINRSIGVCEICVVLFRLMEGTEAEGIRDQ
jgi:hypothetical protein